MKSLVKLDWVKPVTYHPHSCDLVRRVSEHGAGKVRNGHVVICRAVDGLAPRSNGFAVGTVGIWGIGHFAWLPCLISARKYAAYLLCHLPKRYQLTEAA